MNLSGEAQTCLSGYNLFSSQQQIDNFLVAYPACTEILGSIRIQESVSGNITNLNGFSQILTIGGFLNITNNSNLSSLNGLNSLSEIIGSLSIINNSSLLNLDGISNITNSIGNINISNNTMLLNIHGLSNISSINNDNNTGSLAINNNGIIDCIGLENISTIQYRVDISNPNLTSINSLNSLTYVGEDIYLNGNTSLTDINGFNALVIHNGTLYIDNNNSLISITSGFNSIETLGSLNIQFNDNLNIINAFPNLDRINYGLSIIFNPELISFLNTSLDSVGFVSIGLNASLENITGINQISKLGGLSIGQNNLTSLPIFSNLYSMSQQLSISNEPNITDISGLANVVTIGGSLNISGNNQLASISDLENLTSINGYIYIYDNDALTSLSGLGNINPNSISSQFTSQSDIQIVNNDILTTCEVQSICDALLLPGITSDIHDNASGCNSVTEVETVCAALPVEIIGYNEKKDGNNIHLTWQTVSEINNRGFEIEQSLDGTIWNNIGWIDGFIHSTTVQSYQFTHDTPDEGLNYYRLKQLDMDGKYAYSDVVSVLVEKESIKGIYPNPATNILHLGDRKITYSIYNIQGQKLLSGIDISVDVSRLDIGVYIVEVGGDRYRVVKGE